MASITSSTPQGVVKVESTYHGGAIVITTDFTDTGGMVQTTSKLETFELTTLSSNFTTNNTISSSLLPSVVDYEASTTTQGSISTPSLPPTQNCPTEGLWLISY